MRDLQPLHDAAEDTNIFSVKLVERLEAASFRPLRRVICLAPNVITSSTLKKAGRNAQITYQPAPGRIDLHKTINIGVSRTSI